MLKTGLIAMEKVFTGMAQTSDRTMMITTTISVMPHGVSRAEKEELMSGIPPGKALECRTTHGKVQAGADKLMSDSHHEKPGMTPVARAVDPKVHTNRLKMITRSMTAATNGKPQEGVRRLMSDVRGWGRKRISDTWYLMKTGLTAIERVVPAKIDTDRCMMMTGSITVRPRNIHQGRGEKSMFRIPSASPEIQTLTPNNIQAGADNPTKPFVPTPRTRRIEDGF